MKDHKIIKVKNCSYDYIYRECEIRHNKEYIKNMSELGKPWTIDGVISHQSLTDKQVSRLVGRYEFSLKALKETIDKILDVTPNSVKFIVED